MGQEAKQGGVREPSWGHSPAPSGFPESSVPRDYPRHIHLMHPSYILV
jgi:hypothetical protein